jgi:TolB-like protein
MIRTNSLASKKNPYSSSKKKPFTSNILIGVLALIIIGQFAYNRYWGDEPTMVDGLDNSIAILPFIDKSPDGDQEWYTYGIMEEVRNYLVQVQNLKISSGTETLTFKGSDKSFKEIGEELGVAYILTGSVMRLENNIKINIKLTNVKSGQYQWTESYDQQLTGVFSILSEVAQKVASTLNAQIRPQIIERMDQLPTENMEAYDLYLKAIGLPNVVTANNKQAIEWLKEATQLDSKFAEAYAQLGNNILFQAGFVQYKNPSDVGEEGKALLEKALLLDPLNGVVHNIMAAYSLWFEKDFKKAEIHCLTGIRLAPSDVRSYTTYFDLLLSTGRFQKAIPIGTKLLEIDGNNPSNHGRNALLWAFNNDRKKMNENIRQATQAPDNILALTESARAFLIQKQYSQVLEILTIPDSDAIYHKILRVRGLKSISYYKTGDTENHNRELDSLIQKSTETAGSSPSFYIAMIYSSINNVDEAFRWLEKSFQDNEIELYWLKVEPEFEVLYNDVRWKEMLDKVGFPE